MKDVDFFAPGARLALELECLLMDTRNDAAQRAGEEAVRKMFGDDGCAT